MPTLISAITSTVALDSFEAFQNSTKATVQIFWDQNFTNGALFGILCRSMLGVALIAIVFTFLVEYVRHKEKVGFWIIEKLILHSLIAILLIGDGVVLKGVILGMRDAGNTALENIVATARSANNTSQILDAIAGDRAAIDGYKSQFANCRTLAAPEQLSCASAVQAQINSDIASGKIRNKDIRDNLSSAIQGIGDLASTAITDPALAIDKALGAINSVNPVSIAAIAIITIIMGAISRVVTIILELSLFLTCFLAPLYTALSLMPNGAKAIVTWLSWFWGVFIFRLCYTIIVVLSASFLNGSTFSSVEMGVLTAIFAPLMAGILAAGGGMGFYNAAVSIAGKAVEVGISMSTGGASSVAGGAVSVVK